MESESLDQNHRDGAAPHMAQAEHNFPIANVFQCMSVQFDGRSPVRFIHNLNVLEGDPRDSISHGLHEGLFCCEPCGEALEFRGFWKAIA